MTYFIAFLVFSGGAFLVRANTISNQGSVAIARFGHLANACLKDGKLFGNESLEEIEDQISARFGVDYYSTCSFLLDGFGHLNEFRIGSTSSTVRLIAYSDYRSIPEVSSKADASSNLESFYIFCFNREKNCFVGSFCTKSTFELNLASQGQKAEDSRPFYFPVLAAQKALVFRKPDQSRPNKKQVSSVWESDSYRINNGQSRREKQLSWMHQMPVLCVSGLMILGLILAVRLKMTKRG